MNSARTDGPRETKRMFYESKSYATRVTRTYNRGLGGGFCFDFWSSTMFWQEKQSKGDVFC